MRGLQRDLETVGRALRWMAVGAILIGGCGSPVVANAGDSNLQAPPTGGGEKDNVCGCWAGNGTYCGSAMKDHATQNGCNFGGTTADAQFLYSCKDGNWTVLDDCQEPADVTGQCAKHPSGVADSCAGNPCQLVPSAFNGWYCGASKQHGFISLEADWSSVYHCVDGQVFEGNDGPDIQDCGIPGCVVNDQGADACVDPCSGVSSAFNGWYCGSSTQHGFSSADADSGTLYHCVGGKVASDSHGCAFGRCSVNPDPNGADSCSKVLPE